MPRLAPIVVVLSAALACGGTRPRTGTGDTPPPVTDAPLDWSKSGIDWSKPPAAGAEPAWQVPTPSQFQLANGLRVIVVPNRRLPLVSVRMVVAGAGSAADPADQRGLAALVADLLDEGTSQHTALEVARELEREGAYLYTFAGADSAVLGLDGLRSTLPASLRLLAFAVRAPRITDDFERVRADRLSALRLRKDRPSAVASIVLDRVIFGNHSYAHPAAGYESTVQAITADDAVRFHVDHYTPERTTLVVAGDIDAGELRPLVERELGKWSGTAAAPLAAGGHLPTAALPRLIVVDKPKASQTEVRLGRVLITREDPSYFPTRVANTVLGGGFTSRLNRRLREELGYTYGAGSNLWLGRAEGSWSARTALETGSTLDGIREMLRLIEDMRREDVPADELSRAQQLLIRELPDNFAGNGELAGTFAGLVSEGAPVDWYQGFTQGVAGVTVAQVRERAAAIWSRDQLVMVAVGDLGVILDGLRGLGLGDVLEVDADGNVLRTHPAK